MREESIKATAPVKLPSKHCLPVRVVHGVSIVRTQGWYLNVDSTSTEVKASKSPTYPAQAIRRHNANV